MVGHAIAMDSTAFGQSVFLFYDKYSLFLSLIEILNVYLFIAVGYSYYD